MTGGWCGPDGAARLAGAVRAVALTGRPPGPDPVLAALAAEARQFMHGACSLLASDLCARRGWLPVLIEARHPGQGWIMRHAMACPLGAGEAEALTRSGRAFDLPVVDAAGGGTAGERLPLYATGKADMRIVLGSDPDCATRWMWSKPQRPCSIPLLRTLPAACAALGVPFDAAAAVASLAASAHGDRAERPAGADPREEPDPGACAPSP